MRFHSLSCKPVEEDIQALRPLVMHMPISSDGFGSPTVFSSHPVTKNNLIGYYEYLKRHDFNQYIQETGEDLNSVIQRAQAYYDSAMQHFVSEKYKEAIDLYCEVLNEFPLFHEAAEFLALSYMNMEQYDEALYWLDYSVAASGHTFRLDLIRSECYALKDDMESAKKHYYTVCEMPDLTTEELATLERYRKHWNIPLRDI